MTYQALLKVQWDILHVVVRVHSGETGSEEPSRRGEGTHSLERGRLGSDLRRCRKTVEPSEACVDS